MLFSAYAADTYVNGGLNALGNTKYKYNASVFGTTSHSAKMMYVDHSTIRFYISPVSTGSHNDVAWGTPVMMMTRGGKIGVNTTTPSYTFDVNGSLNASSMYNSGQLQWSDFVFEDNYELPTLVEVAKHIEKKGHLKDIPREAEVIKEGYNPMSLS